jgi:hypothetical protein
MDKTLLLKTPALPGTASKTKRRTVRSPSPAVTDFSDDEAPFPLTATAAEVKPEPFKLVYTGAIEAIYAHTCDDDGYTSCESI